MMFLCEHWLDSPHAFGIFGQKRTRKKRIRFLGALIISRFISTMMAAKVAHFSCKAETMVNI